MEGDELVTEALLEAPVGESDVTEKKTTKSPIYSTMYNLITSITGKGLQGERWGVEHVMFRDSRGTFNFGIAGVIRSTI
jgi:hypothetical protein